MAVGWDIRRVYLYLVSFTTLIMVIIGAVMIINDLIDVVYPPTEMYYVNPPKTEYRQRYEDFKRANPNTNVTYEEYARDLTAENEKNVEMQKKQEKPRIIREFLKSSALIVVALPIYLYHWRRIQLETPKPQPPTPA